MNQLTTNAAPERAPDVVAAPAGRSTTPARPAPLGGLTVGDADDPAEHAADVRADAALARLRRAASARPGPVGSTEAHRHDPACGHLRRASARAPSARARVGAEGGALDPATSARISASVGSGVPLAPAVRERMETAFGASLGHVRVHDGPEAAQHAASVSAAAFTTGSDIFLGAGQPGPEDPAGERVLAHEIAHVLAEPGGAPDVQRVHLSMARYQSVHGEKNQDYLREWLPDTKLREYDLAVAAAILLDHDYDARPLLSGPEELDEVELQVRRDFPGVDGNDVSNQMAYWMDKPPAFLSEFLRTYIAEHSSIDQGDLTWGPVDDLGRGTSVTAKFVRNNHAAGSDAGGWNPWAAALFRRGDAKSSFYVRGHLLNRHLGGPGLDYNLVPLTHRAGYGGNDANAAHSKMFEEVIKQKFELLDVNSRQQVEDLEYSVTVDPAGEKRSATAVVLEMSDEIVAMIRVWHRDVMMQEPISPYDSRGVDRLADHEVDQALALKGGWPTADVLGPGQKREALALSLGPRERLLSEARDARPTVTGGGRKASLVPLGASDEGGRLLRRLSESAELGRLVRVVCADIGGNPARLSADDLRERVLGNRDLWELEDKLVPKSLTVRASWEQFRTTTDFGPHVIPIQKPDDLFSPYWHHRDSFIG